jgi:predicted GNAT superfamily acetyltransferase
MPHLPDRAAEPVLRVEIPNAIDEVQATSLSLAARWRATTRAAFEWAMAAGYRVDGFHRDDTERAWYLLSRAAPAVTERA